MITIDEIISIGKFNKAHGINGELSATITAPQVVLDNCSCISQSTTSTTSRRLQCW